MNLLYRFIELKDNLVAFYKLRHSTIPLSPFLEKYDTPLVDFYVLPQMNLIEKQKKTAKEETKTPAKISDVLKSEKSREIYLTADAGFGKTAFSKYLTITWCQAHRHEEKYKEYFLDDAIKTMRDFEFLFLVLLRDSSEYCSIDNLILNQIMQGLSRSSAITIDSLQEILHREKCLVILDGLDEWTHPEKKCTKVPKMIPHRNAREKCVILTTTRPWKLGIINLKTSEIDKQVELVKLTSTSAQTLEGRAISKIEKIGIAEAENRAKQLHKKIEENELENLESVPLLAMYLICLWCDDIPLGQSRCGLYASITELLLKRTISKHPEMEMREPSQSDIPQCFNEHKKCTKYGAYLKALGKLSFETLLCETKERTLVFNKSVAKKHLSPSDMKLSLDSGLLTQTKEESLTKKKSKVSFAHKTVQEFFCSLYICCQNESDVKNIILNKCKSLQRILDMSAVFVFISGMNAEIMYFISHQLMSEINNDTTTREYRSTTSWECEPLKDIQTMFMSCMKENKHVDVPHLFCQDFFFDIHCSEENDFSYLARLTKYNKNNMHSININTDYSRNLCQIIEACGLKENFNVNKVVYEGRYEEKYLLVLLNKSPTCLVVETSYDHVGLWDYEMWKALKNNSLLQVISIKCFKMSHDVLQYFFEHLVNTKTFTEIELKLLSCTDHYLPCSFPLEFSEQSVLSKLKLHRYIPKVLPLKVNCQVKHVELYDIKLGERALPSEMVNLEHVDLRYVEMSPSTLHELVKGVEKLSHKVKVKLHFCTIEPSTEFKQIKQYVHKSQNLLVTLDNLAWFLFETNVES